MIKTDDLYDTYGFAMGPDPDYVKAPIAAESPTEEEVTTRTLTLNFTEETSGETTHTGITLEDGKTEYLPTVMAAVEMMLHAMGFNYVSLVNISESGHNTYGYGSVN